jgi:hypothetical protein
VACRRQNLSHAVLARSWQKVGTEQRAAEFDASRLAERGTQRSVILVGTSGWQYRSWRGGFHPEGLPQRLWLEHYAAAFDTVELNNAFYRLPERSTFVQWRERTPQGPGVVRECSL